MVSLIIARMYVLLKASISSWLVELSFLMFKISHQHDNVLFATICVCVCVHIHTESYPTLCDPMDC